MNVHHPIMPSKYDHLPPDVAELLQIFNMLHQHAPTHEPSAMATLAAAVFTDRRRQDSSSAS